MSDHLIAEANRHAMALPTTQPTHADIAWYVREVYELRAELELLREWQREVIQNANAHHAEREDAIARAERAEAESIQLKKANIENADSYRLMQGRVMAAQAELATERARLDWMLTYITQLGVTALHKIAWTVYDQEGESMMHRETIAEEEIGEIRFDRPALDAAMKEETK